MSMGKSFFAFGLIVVASLPQQVMAEPADKPIFQLKGNESLVMLTMSNDHELYFKAYDDYSDINNDNIIDTTYNNKIEYYGYFDSEKCYDYTNSVFVPKAEMTTKYYCDTVAGSWSGNFLNWATMTRIDAIRKVLYGGYRSTDSGSKTVLERSFLPSDAHSFAKFYAGSDIDKLTSHAFAEISICNTTPFVEASSNNSKDMLTSKNPPEMRVAEGDYSMWASHGRMQCQWDDEPSNPESNGNVFATTGLNAASSPPTETGNNQGYIVRVEVCTSDLPESNCKVYPNLNRKPIGLLQEHGEDGLIKFGLLTGSYAKNKSGGVVRKNVSDFSDEINSSDGTFLTPNGGAIVDTLNRFRLTNYSYSDWEYNDLDKCEFAKFTVPDGECSNWLNPQSEIYLESLRYFAGENSGTAAFAADDSSYIAGIGDLPNWEDPLSSENYCAPVNIIHFNSSTSSFDGDQLGGFGLLAGSPDVDALTKTVGEGEGVTSGVDVFVGVAKGSGAGGTDLDDKSCSPKSLADLSKATGVCPEAPWLEGTYKIAGMAYHANLNSIRTDLNDADGNVADIFVKTYGVALSPAQPVIEIPIPGSADDDENKIILLPACMEFRDSGARHNGNCAIVDFRVVRQDLAAGTGKFNVLWESAQFGGDYDQDMAGTIEYSINSGANTITVTTNVYAESTGGIHGFGYVISGTTQDGLHIHSGINNFDDYRDPYGDDVDNPLIDCYTDPSDSDNNCDVGDGPTSNTYNIGTSTAKRLETPLYYAAKWGGFKEESESSKRPEGAAGPNNKPDQAYEWDNDGDGLPDNYFFARNPGSLSDQLASVFDIVASVSSAAAVATSTTRLETTTRIYQARFDSSDWSGELLALPIDVTTETIGESLWDAGEQIAKQNHDTGREIITWNGTEGVPFRWETIAEGEEGVGTELSSVQQSALNTSPISNENDDLGIDRVAFLRGDTSTELQNGGSFRNRSTPLGDVVNSNPLIVGVPNFAYRDYIPGTDTLFEAQTYSAFRNNYANSSCFGPDGTPITSWTAGTGDTAGGREPLIYFGANDGALHAVSGCSGEERLAYVPNAVYSKLNLLTSTDYVTADRHKFYVDGPPVYGDAFWGGKWHTVLVGTLAAGGKGIFALDITDPNIFDEANADTIVLWDKTNTDTDYGELGYTFGSPAVVKAQGHGWVAIFGNGYHGQNGSAVLYIANIQNGGVTSINLSGKEGHGTENGLSQVSPIDTDGDGDVDLLYAGDLNGNVWRFEADPDNGFTLDGATLLFTAKNKDGDPQPITSRIEIGLHPTSPAGYMLYFGTGKYYELEDQDPATAVTYNSIYGLWDRVGTQIPSVVTRNSEVLQQQTVTLEDFVNFTVKEETEEAAAETVTRKVRVVSNTSMKWVARGDDGSWNSCGADASCGWYLDLPIQGEKAVNNLRIRRGFLRFVTTIPSKEPCEAGGSSWNMVLDARSGGRPDFPIFDTNGDRVFDDKDMVTTEDGAEVVAGQFSDDLLGDDTSLGTGKGYDLVVQPNKGTGEVGDDEVENRGAYVTGRKSWARIK